MKPEWVTIQLERCLYFILFFIFFTLLCTSFATIIFNYILVKVSPGFSQFLNFY